MYVNVERCEPTYGWASCGYGNVIFIKGLRYANVIKNINYTLSISAILPFGSFLCFFGLLIIYWCDKWLILRRMVCQNYLSQSLSFKMLKQLKYSVLFFSIGIFNSINIFKYII